MAAYADTALSMPSWSLASWMNPHPLPRCAASASSVLIWTSLSAVLLFGADICLYLHTPELFPTRMRALGTSVGGAVNRLGVILGPIVVGAAYAGGTLGTVFVTLAAVALIGAVAAGGRGGDGRAAAGGRGAPGHAHAGIRGRRQSWGPRIPRGPGRQGTTRTTVWIRENDS